MRKSGRRRRRPLRSVIQGIVGEHGIDADHGGVGGPAEMLNSGAGDFAGDPVGRVRRLLRRRRRDARVEGHGDLHEDEGALMLNPAGETLIEAAGFSLAGAERNFDSRGAECLETPAGDGRVGIDGGGNDPPEVCI